MNTPQRIRITEQGWSVYTGMLGTVSFTDGISDELVIPSQAQHLGSIVRIEAIDDDHQIGASAHLLRSMNDRAPVVLEMGKQQEQTAAPPQAESAPVAYTKESLSALADARGIQGIREIADKLGIKGRSIVELIDGIVAATEAKVVKE